MSKISRCLLAAVAAALLSQGGLLAGEAAEQKKDAPKTAQERAQQALKRLDADGDGQLSFDEFKGKRRRPEAVEKAEAIFKLLDRNGDKKVTLEEFASKPAEVRFKTMDRNGDGKLTLDELKGQRKQPEQIERAERSFKRMDKDSDGTVTLEEFKQGQQRRGPAGGGGKARPDTARILGTWDVAEKNGQADTGEKGNQCVFAKEKMTLKVKDGESFDLKYKLDAAKQPKELDLVIEYEGKTYALKCIYELQRDTLRICGATGPDKPRPSQFKAKEDEQNVYVLRRVRKKQK